MEALLSKNDNLAIFIGECFNASLRKDQLTAVVPLANPGNAIGTTGC